jgi:hypothetical protein
MNYRTVVGLPKVFACNGLVHVRNGRLTHKLPLWREVSECVFVGVCVTVCVCVCSGGLCVFVFTGLVTCLDLDKEGIVLSDLEEVCPWFLLGVVAFTRRGVGGVASKACTCVLLFYELGSVSLFWASSLTAKKSGCWVLLCVH